MINKIFWFCIYRTIVKLQIVARKVFKNIIFNVCITCYCAFNVSIILSIFKRHTDPQYIKTKKLEILTTIASVSNVEEVVTELR